MPPLPRDFYLRPTLLVARDLLGMHLCHHLPAENGAPGRVLSGRIVEVEAYEGPEDRASHARLRKGPGKQLVPTDRSALMFGPPGISYVYLIYGMHHCFNAVAHAEGAVGAVLIRALEPREGMKAGLKAQGGSCRGPARLCAVMGIDRRHNGVDLTCPPPGRGEALTIEDRGTGVADADVVSGPRIGVDYAGEDALRPYRLCDRTSTQLSRKP